MVKAKGNHSKSKKSTTKLSAEDFVRLLKSVSNPPEVKESPLLLLENSQITNPLLVVGEESIRVRRLVKWFADSFFRKDSGEEAVSVIYGKELSSTSAINKLLETLGSFSLFSKSKLLIIYEADKIRASQADIIAEYVKRQKMASFLVLVASTINNKTPLLNRLSDHSMLVEVGKLKGNKFARWVEKEARLAGASGGINRDALELLISCYGEDILAISQELAKLALLTKEDQLITKSLVRMLSFKNPTRTSFELVSRIAAKDLLSSLKLADDLISQGLHPLQLNAFFSRAFRSMLFAKEPAELSHSKEFGAELRNTWFLRNLSAAIKSFSIEELFASISVLKELDFKLKDSGLPATANLKTAIQRITTRTFANA